MPYPKIVDERYIVLYTLTLGKIIVAILYRKISLQPIYMGKQT